MLNIQLLIQLSGLITVAVGVVRQDLVVLSSGFAVIVLNIATAIDESQRKIDKLEAQLAYEDRLDSLEKQLEQAKMKKAQMSSQTLLIVLLVILILIWLWKNGFLPSP